MLKLNSVNTDAEIQLFTTSHQSYIGDYLNGMYFYSNSASVPTMVLSPGAPGKVGIGTTSPTYQLDVSGSNSMLRLNSSSVYSEIQLANTSHVSYIGDYASGLNFFSNNNAVPTMVIAPGAPGKVGIGTTSPGQKLDVAGTIRQSNCTTAGTLSTNASGDIICTSDARLKNIRSKYEGGLDAILRITPRLFTYKPTPSNPVETFVHAGFIAQNVKEVIPEAVALQRSGFYSLDTTAILAASINAIKKLKAVNDRQSAEMRRLRSELVSEVRVRSRQDQEIGALKASLLMIQQRLRTQTASN